MNLFEPSPLFLAFAFVQRFVYFEVVALIALIRTLVGRGAVRIPAVATLVMCGLAILVTFAPALGLHTHAAYPIAARLVPAGSIAPQLAVSAVFALCLLFPQRRWRWLDVLHLLCVIAFLGVYAATLVL